MRRSAISILVATAALAALGSGCATSRAPNTSAAASDERRVTRVDLGRQLFVKYCASCHSANGTGDGPAAAGLDQRPANLTLIAKANGGEFPYGMVYRTIDGRQSPRAHGNSDMPVWGNVFKDSATMDVNDRAAVEGRIMLLTSYIESIQQL